MTTLDRVSETLSRRLLMLAVITMVACRKSQVQQAQSERCPHCGMLVDPKSAFRTELVAAGVTRIFDTPRCAFAVMRASATPNAPSVVRVQEFYTRQATDAESVRFVAGSDVEGPMGPELIPVAPDKVDKFMRDHRGARVYQVAEISADVLKKEGTP